MDGLIIRPVRVDDAEAINRHRRQPGVWEGILALPSDRVEGTRRFLESLGPDDHVVVAEFEGRLVGMVGLHLSSGKKRHVGSVGISVDTALQGQGVGRQLLTTVLDLADNVLGLVRVELEVIHDNDRAIRLYESLGFAHEGCKRMDLMRDGRYIDTLVMGRIRPGMDGER